LRKETAVFNSNQDISFQTKELDKYLGKKILNYYINHFAKVFRAIYWKSGFFLKYPLFCKVFRKRHWDWDLH